MPLCLPAGKSNNPDVGGPWWLAGEDAERWSSYTTERANATSRHPETPYWLHLPSEKPTDRSHRCMYSVFQKTFWNIFTLVKFFCLKFCKFVGNSYRRLRSGSTSTLLVPSTRRATLGDRAFPVGRPLHGPGMHCLRRSEHRRRTWHFVASWKHCYSRHRLKTGHDCAIYLLHSVNCKFWHNVLYSAPAAFFCDSVTIILTFIIIIIHFQFLYIHLNISSNGVNFFHEYWVPVVLTASSFEYWMQTLREQGLGEKAIIFQYTLTKGGSWAVVRKSAVESTTLAQPFCVNQAVGLGNLSQRLHAQSVVVRQFSHWCI